MTACTCPHGLVQVKCEYHQEVAQRFLESINTAPDTPPLIAQHYAPGGYTPKENR